MSIVYILTNESMPGYIKIGRTETSVPQRMSELDKTSMPLPFQCYYAARVDDYARVEKTLHTAFADHRVRQSREFFKMDPYKAKVILELLVLEDVTPRDDASLDAEGKDALEKASRVGSRYNLEKYGIPKGSILEYTSDTSITCTVVDEKTVDFMGEAGLHITRRSSGKLHAWRQCHSLARTHLVAVRGRDSCEPARAS